jgi:hypothetical protein
MFVHVRWRLIVKSLPLALVVLSLALPLTTEAATATPPPLSVAVGSSTTGAIVTWLPPASTTPASGYNVYGISAEGVTFLGHADAPADAMVVPSGFDTYGVSAVIAGNESGITEPCVAFSVLPPEADVHSSCPTRPPSTSRKVRVMGHDEF